MDNDMFSFDHIVIAEESVSATDVEDELQMEDDASMYAHAVDSCVHGYMDADSIVKAEDIDSSSFVDSHDVAAQFQESSDDEEVHADDNALVAGEDSTLDQFLDTCVGCLGICNVRCITYKCNGKGMNR